MLQSLSPGSRRLPSSLAFSALLVLVVGLGYLTFCAVSERRHAAEKKGEAPESTTVPFIDIASFSARRERTSDAERLAVSLRLRLTAPGTVDCFAYIVARNDHVSPKLWAVWPTQGSGGAVTAGGHFDSHEPTTGQAVTLTPSWTRVTATLAHPPGQPPFEVVMVYVVSPKGEILLSRPFAL